MLANANRAARRAQAGSENGSENGSDKHVDDRADEERLERFAEGRKQNQPTEHPSCGSVFLKPPGDFAGRLIEAAGLKGSSIGAIEVSTLHANFFINRGGGSSADVLELVRRVENDVLERFEVRLEREFIYWKD